MQRVECGGLQCWADGVRFLNTAYWSQEIGVLSMFGARNAVRAAWARLSTKARHSSYLEIGGKHACLVEGEKYVTLQAQMTRQMLHLVILHPAATHQYNPFAQNFLQIGPEPSVRYFPRLNRMCPIPFRQTWREWLWENGLENSLIKPLPGFGIPGYLIDATEAWAPLIKQGIESGKLV